MFRYLGSIQHHQNGSAQTAHLIAAGMASLSAAAVVSRRAPPVREAGGGAAAGHLHFETIEFHLSARPGWKTGTKTG